LVKKFVLAVIVLTTLCSLSSCEKRHEGEKTKIDTYEQELFQFSNVFMTRHIFEDKNYIYLSSFLAEGENMARVNKETKETEDLNIPGFMPTVYKNHLYYLDSGSVNNIYNLYRIDLDKPEWEPELVHSEVNPTPNNYYYIANDAIWLYPIYFPTYRIDTNDFSKKTKYSYEMPENYFMAGIDEKYRYIFVWEIENDKIENGEIYSVEKT